MTDLRQLVDDTYAEGFRSIYGEILLTARDEKWLSHCISAVTGHSSSTILCDCEAGVAHWVGPSQTPDGRIGAIVQFHVPRFRKDRREHLEKVMLARISQTALTCPTIRCSRSDEPGHSRRSIRLRRNRCCRSRSVDRAKRSR